ncbi:hypothetical protein AKJ51_00265 [candidate division MSBL1 archaeon SCGC-AAA382A20]|uniref:Uncharacterized protein n=1 Tax=candidate division MSBL1 archaeon SCGC-AAA382A20 TaxID=1698280 RepID=A0A133VML5_9EURY|nr:hypothetical protein AKJ51_00265 [candidate division MSBL1 archaeon SCGC-AAA382A20]
MSLDKKLNRPSMSIMTIEKMEGPETVKGSIKCWKDSEIKSQFREFLRNISFHKGTYFLSQDGENVIMSGGEGFEGLYL